jgi:hypothetical protein
VPLSRREFIGFFKQYAQSFDIDAFIAPRYAFEL